MFQLEKTDRQTDGWTKNSKNMILAGLLSFLVFLANILGSTIPRSEPGSQHLSRHSSVQLTSFTLVNQLDLQSP